MGTQNKICAVGTQKKTCAVGTQNKTRPVGTQNIRLMDKKIIIIFNNVKKSVNKTVLSRKPCKIIV